jgi:ketosteroid isomerase-like protein
MQEFIAAIEELNELIKTGDTLAAIKKFYADDVVMQENEENPRVGKEQCLQNERENLAKVKELNGKLLNQAIDFKKK